MVNGKRLSALSSHPTEHHPCLDSLVSFHAYSFVRQLLSLFSIDSGSRICVLSNNFYIACASFLCNGGYHKCITVIAAGPPSHRYNTSGDI